MKRFIISCANGNVIIQHMKLLCFSSYFGYCIMMNILILLHPESTIIFYVVSNSSRGSHCKRGSIDTVHSE